MTSVRISASVSLVAGTTIFIPSGAAGEHLIVVIIGAKMVGKVEKILLAPIETVIPKSDISCLLDVDDHPFIIHKSHMGYRHCREDDLSHVMECIQSGYFRLGQTVSNDVLNRIARGYTLSNQVPRYIKRAWDV